MRQQSIAEFGYPLTLIQVPEPVPTGSEVLIRVDRCGLCHTDLHLQDGYYDLGGGKKALLVDRGIVPPLILGHEVLGTLVAAGPNAGVAPEQFGKTFLIYPWIGCRDCEPCHRNSENLCAAPRAIGVVRPGGYGEFCLVPDARYLVEVTGVEPGLAATYACSGLTAYSAVKKVDPTMRSERLLIVGLGGVGYSALQIAQALGFSKIAVADLDAAKRARALEDGADLAIDPTDPSALESIAKMGGTATAIDFVGTSSTVNFAYASLMKGGTCIVVGLFGGEISVPIPTLVQRSITLRGSFVGTPQELSELIVLAQSGRLKPLPIEEVAFEKVNLALDRLRAGEVSGRLVLTYDSAIQ